jgi:hypothetical protein
MIEKETNWFHSQRKEHKETDKEAIMFVIPRYRYNTSRTIRGKKGREVQ